MKYDGFIADNKLFITHCGVAVIENLKVQFNIPHSRDRIAYFHFEEITYGDNEFCAKLVPDFTDNYMRVSADSFLRFKEENGTLTAYIDFNTNGRAGFHNFMFDGYESAKLLFDIPNSTAGSMSLHTVNPYWLNCDFRPLNEVYGSIDCTNYNINDTHINILPVYSQDFACELRNTGLTINTRISGLTHLSGAVMSIAADDNALTVTHKNIDGMRKNGIITAPPIEERLSCDALDGFGWCTWDAFYHDVTADKILQKMEEFKAMNIIPKWVLIDDGWSQTDDGYLLAYEVDKQKFPNGLDDLVAKVKSYGVSAVGVWHAIGGYWEGLSSKSKLYTENPDGFFKIPNGNIYAGPDEQKIFDFYDKWYTYLKAEGIDFVKVDNQSSMLTKFDNIYRGSTGTANVASALDRAVEKHFGGAIINCMGSTLENIVNRKKTLINRNSDDFFPNKKEDFSLHTVQNVYTATLQREFHCCDFDMFFSKHPTGVGSAVIRAISGGPIYVSDKLDGTDPEVLAHLCDEHGNTPKFDNFAVPTPDCFYIDCAKEGKVLKAFNTKGDNIAVACFGVSPEKTAVGTLRLADVTSKTEKYIAHNYFTDEYTLVDESTEIPLSLEYNGYALITLYPIAEDGTVKLGDTAFYAEGATTPKKICSYTELLK